MNSVDTNKGFSSMQAQPMANASASGIGKMLVVVALLLSIGASAYFVMNPGSKPVQKSNPQSKGEEKKSPTTQPSSPEGKPETPVAKP